MSYEQFNISVWKGNTGTIEHELGLVVRSLDSNGVPVVPDSVRFTTKNAVLDKDSVTGGVLINQVMTINGEERTGYTIVPFSAAETRTMVSTSYELEYITAVSQRTEFYGSIKAKGGLNVD